MATYSIVDKVIDGTPADVAAEAETYLETLDSTNNPIYFTTIVGDNMWCKLTIIHKG